MTNWWDKTNERKPGEVLSRVPKMTYIEGSNVRGYLEKRLEEALTALDKAEAEKEAVAREAWEAGLAKGVNQCAGYTQRYADFNDWWNGRAAK